MSIVRAVSWKIGVTYLAHGGGTTDDENGLTCILATTAFFPGRSKCCTARTIAILGVV